jgi:hypothetical protein
MQPPTPLRQHNKKTAETKKQQQHKQNQQQQKRKLKSKNENFVSDNTKQHKETG